MFGPLFFAAPAFADEAQPTVIVVTTPGGDDSSYQVPLTTTVTFDGVTYDSVYATTNSVITFGRPDGTYWDFPRTPSISLYSMDWVVYPSWRADEHLVISASDGGFQVDISARPIWLQNATEPTNINIVAAINTDGTVAISYSLTGPIYDGQTRTGVRLTNGSVVTLEQYGIVQVEQPPVLAPEPVAPTPEPSPEPSLPPVVPVEPTPEPSPVQPVVPAPEPQPAPAPQPEVQPQVEPEVPPQPTPEPEPVPTIAPAPEPPVELIPAPEPPVIEPEPILPQTEAEVVAELAANAQADDPQLDPAIAAIPVLGEALGAVLDTFNQIGNLGADMTPEVRQQAEKTVVASVIVGQVASSAAAAAAASSGASTRKNK